MSVCYASEALTVHLGDCLNVLPSVPAASVHAVVTDPPYGLEFMGQDWDAPWRSDPNFGHTRSRYGRVLNDGSHRLPWPSGPHANVRCRSCHRWRVSSCPCRCPQPDFHNLLGATQHAYQDWCQRWAAECLRVLKPGGHLVAFGETRTYHRLACAVEDAGFEIRDSIHWIYGQGFPKSLNVAKAIDKAERVGRSGSTTHAPQQPGTSSYRGRGGGTASARPMARTGTGDHRRMTSNARTWQGWGTALKPAHEPILLARKPLAGTVAANVISHHTGGLNIDACRAADADRHPQVYAVTGWKPGAALNREGGAWKRSGPDAPVVRSTLPPGRWPANIAFSHAPGCADGGSCAPGCPVADLGVQAGVRRSGANPVRRHGDMFRTVYGRFTADRNCRALRGAEAGSAARFFPVFRYHPKATAAERPHLPGIAHPTVKPLDLMRWLVRLVAPPGGLVLDPFAGTGTTLHACLLEGMRGIGIERDQDYAELCKMRVRAVEPRAQPPEQA